MKVYTLYDPYEKNIEIYSTDGKTAKDKEILAEAELGRARHIEALEAQRLEYHGKAVYWYNEAARALSDEASTIEINDLLNKRDANVASRKAIEAAIESVKCMPDEDIIRRYGCGYCWTEYELIEN